MQQSPRARLAAYGVAVLATGLSLVIRLPLVPWLGYHAELMTFFPAIILSAYLGGLGPGLLATFLGAAAGDYFFIEPRYSFRIHEPGAAYALGLFVLAGAVISGLMECLHGSRRRIAASERRYAVTLASIGDAVLATDTRARVTFLNPVAEALTGWPTAEAAGRPLTEVFRIVNERTRQPVEDPAAKVLRLGTVVGLANHTALLARDGRETPIDDCGAPIIDDRGAVAGVVLVFRDVSQRRQLEEAEVLRRANERMELAVRGSNVGVWDVDMPDGDFLHARRNYVNVWEQLGYDGPPADEAIALDEAHPDDRARLEEAARRYLAGETREFETEMRIRHRDGSYRTMLARGAAVRDAGGKPIRFLGITVDITKLKLTEEALRESEQRWRGLTEALPQLVWSAMPDGACDYFSTQWTEHTGIAEAELLGWGWLRTLHPEDREPTRQLWLESVAGRHPYDVEYRVRRRDGEYRWFKTRGVPIRGGDGNIVKWFGTCTDITDLRQTEEALRASEGRFRVFVDHAADAFFLHDEQTRVLDVNRRACESLGYSRDELIGMTAFDFDPDHTPARRADVLRQIDTGKTAAFESRHRRKDGTTFPVEVRSRAFWEGDHQFIVSLVRDITERKEAEEALRESEGRFRGTFENAAVGISHTDLEGRWLRVNAKLCAILGYTIEEALRLRWQDVTFPEDVPESTEHLTALLRGERRSYSLEKRYVRKDGSVIWGQLDVSLQRDAAGQPAYVIAVIQDISERKRLDAELRRAKEAEAERARLAELGRDVGIALTQGDTLHQLLQPCAEAVVRYLDAAFARVWWLPPGGDVLELHASAGLYTHLDGPHARIPAGRLKIGRIAQERRPVLTNEVQSDPCISDPDWARREGMVAFAGFPLVVKDRLLGVLGMFARRPLSEAVLQALESVAGLIALGIERKQQEAELRRAKDAAEAASKAKDEFLAGVSHEIRTPMNAILGMTELALGTPLNEEQRKFLTIVKTSADALLGVINDLLDFSRIEAGKLELDCADFSLRTTLNETLRALALRAHRKGLELVCHVRPDVPDFLVGDPGRLRQVLLNLVGNAVKFTEQGEVVLEVTRLSDVVEDRGSRIEHREEGRGPSSILDPRSSILDPRNEVLLHFSVRDTGMGIPPDKQERIFRAFEQADNSTTRRYEGTGLGLAIASRLVALMGGRLTVQSEPGKGSTFRFTAPFGQQPDRPAGAPVQPPVDLRGLRVLVVDDNSTNRLILEQWLRDWQTEPATAPDGLSALDALWRGAAGGWPYSLVLLDARMPDTDGLALAAKIARCPEFSACRIILLSSEDHPGDLARHRQVGVGAVLMKPLEQEELLDAIHRVLSRPGTQPAESPAPAAAPGGAGPAPGPPACPLRVLLAEDNEFNQQVVQHLLARQGHTVEVAGDGRQALAALERGGFDLVLLDVHMPELDGFGVVRAVRERERSAGGHLPVLALTARATRGDRERCLEAGMDDYLAKPIRPAELLAAIDRALAARPPTREERPVPRGPAPLLDPNVALASCGGDDALLRTMVQSFQANVPGHLARVEDAVGRQSPADLREAAHKLRGLVSAFSTTAAEAALRLEEMGACGRLAGAGEEYARLADMVRGLGPLLSRLAAEGLEALPQVGGDPP